MCFPGNNGQGLSGMAEEMGYRKTSLKNEHHRNEAE
jgi:hypothetical protein